MTHDGLGKYLSQRITKAPGSTVDIAQVLKDTRTDVVVSYLPVGSEQATKWYVEQILEAGCGFVNCIPVFIAREDYWNNRFVKAGLPIIGDDIKSQVGATIVHRQLARLFHDRGVKLMRTSQLNVGGNMDFFNMLERERLESKKESKTNAVTSIMGHDLPADDVHVGPSDYVPWLTDRKWAHIRLEGQAFGDVPLQAELKLEVWDSPNSAGIVTDAVRLCKLALNHGVAGQLDGPSSYLMKSPHSQRPDDEARELSEDFIVKYARLSAAARQAQGGEDAAPPPSSRRRPSPMRRAAAVLTVVAALLAAAAPAGAAPRTPTDVRVMSFNIWLGGDVVDFGGVVRAIHAADADIVGLQEAEGNTRPDREGARLAVLERPAARRLALPADRPARRGRPVRPRAGEARPGLRARQRAPPVRPVRPVPRARRQDAQAGPAQRARDPHAGGPRGAPRRRAPRSTPGSRR